MQVRNNTMVACSAIEVANKIAVLQGIASEPDSPTSKRCSRIYNECFAKEGKTNTKPKHLLMQKYYSKSSL